MNLVCMKNTQVKLSLGVKLRGEMGAEISYLGVDTVAALGSLMTGRTQSEGFPKAFPRRSHTVVPVSACVF